MLVAIAATSGTATAQVCGLAEDGTTPLAALTLERVNGEPATGLVEMPFADRRGPKSLLFEYKVEGCAFARSDFDDELDGVEFFTPRDRSGDELDTGVRASGEIKASQVVVVTLRVDPNDAAAPGTFRTGFAISDDRFELYRQDVAATLRYTPSWVLALSVLVPVAFVGTLLVWAKGRAGGSKETLGKWLRKGSNLFAIGAGFAASLGYLDSVVFADPDFGRQLHDNAWWQWPLQSDWFKTVGAAGSAYVTALLGFSLVGDRARGGTDAEGQAGQSGRFA